MFLGEFLGRSLDRCHRVASCLRGLRYSELARNLGSADRVREGLKTAKNATAAPTPRDPRDQAPEADK